MRGRAARPERTEGAGTEHPGASAPGGLELPQPDRLLSIREVMSRVKMGQTTLYRRLSAGAFPKPVRHGDMNLWRESTISAWIASLPEVDHSRTGPRFEGGSGRGARGRG